MTDHRPGDRNPIADILSQNAGPDATRSALDAEIRRARVDLLDSVFPPDVARRYARIRAEQLAAVAEAARHISSALAEGVDGDVLSGAVAQKVKDGIAEIAGQKDYARGIESIT
ncbi:hypothetical protein ACF1AJ_17955 [Leifsonia sp. NPDC014704]|uniref:hypothetical protein n=1 Tax=unclassified Leifsonia TaxID=2663824 RepID=UPI00036A2DF3|nr:MULTISPECIES: hypothetical protein [unclassified Leifsonia]TDP99044.1 hypothetical protein AXZ95_2954 [Leifsonia sp. 115AMFTsu3.1]